MGADETLPEDVVKRVLPLYHAAVR